MVNDEPVNCIFLAFDPTLEIFYCLKGHDWQCQTDATYCGDVCPDFKEEK
jgi:hypothetical protein